MELQNGVSQKHAVIAEVTETKSALDSLSLKSGEEGETVSCCQKTI